MNLVSDPWIPALRANGAREMFSLNALFDQAHEIRDLAAKPHERIALMRLLICITQAALDGPADQDAWEVCEGFIQARVREYLGRWKGGFELFGNGERFMQLLELQRGSGSDEGNAATKLDLSLATGNNPTLFDNLAAEDRPQPQARAALNLLTFQCFSPGGRIGVARWNQKDTPGQGSSNHAPCTPSSMVHALPLGKCLLHTLHLNLITKQTVQGVPNAGWGKPIWEMPVARLDDTKAVSNATMTYLGRLVPLSRAVRVDEDGLTIVLANGLDYPIFPAFREATATVVQRKDELTLLPASTGKSFWRQLSAIALKRRAAADQTAGPLALSNLHANQNITLWLGAFATDKAKIEDVIESSYSLPAGMLTDIGHMAYEAGVHYAEGREGMLRDAVKAYATELKVVSPLYDRARQHFWTYVEQQLSALFDLARNPVPKDDIPKSTWAAAVRRAAEHAYEQTCARQTPRQIQAYALGLRRLYLATQNKPGKSNRTVKNHEQQ